MKRFLFTILIFASVQGFAQTFKITEVKTSDTREYQKANKKFLNNEFKVSFNDNSITVTPTAKYDPLTLKKVNESTYSFSTRKGDTEEYYSVVFKKTFGVISSLVITLTKRTPSYTDVTTLTGRRF